LMRRFLPDTSCMIAAVSAWHEVHDAAASELGRRLEAGEELVVAAHALIEAYSVLTRLPAPHRLAPSDALAVLEGSFGARGRVIALDARGYRWLLRGAPSGGVAGGRIYDAVIAACARKAKATVLLTFNVEHFEPFADDSLEIVVPVQH
jgi:predicted nucleic acid-binding protein